MAPPAEQIPAPATVPAAAEAPVFDRTAPVELASAVGLEVDQEARQVRVDGGVVDLLPTEYDLLVELLGSGRRTRSRADLVLALRGESHVTTYVVTEADRHAVALHIAHLRTKLGDTGSRPRFIETVEGVGYRMVVS